MLIAGRLFAKLLGEPGRLPLGSETWSDTAVAAAGLAEGARLTNLLTGETLMVREGSISMAEAFANFPAAVLLGGQPG